MSPVFIPLGGYPKTRQAWCVSTHSRPKAAAPQIDAVRWFIKVSTHSRSKAAATASDTLNAAAKSFNSQPLEGGCIMLLFITTL